MSAEAKELYWEHRLRARDWVRQLRKLPAETLGSERVLWTLEELIHVMLETTKASTITQHAFGRLLRRAGFYKINCPLRTGDAQRNFWVMRPGMKMTYGSATKLYAEERSGNL